MSSLNAPAKLFRNTTPGAQRWFAIRLEGVKSNRQGIGAEITVTLTDGRKLHNHATSSVGYASSSEPAVRFGLGLAAEVKDVEIQWPGGAK